MTHRSRLALAVSVVALAGCAGQTLDVRAVHRGLDGKTLSAFDQAYQGGKANLASNHVGLALVLFEKALAIEPNSAAALNAIGAAYDELHFPNIAARYYAKALAIEPNSADTLNNMALSARIAGKPDDARALFERALAVDAANRTIRANLNEMTAPAPVATAAREERAPDGPVVEQIGENTYKIDLPHAVAAKQANVAVEPSATAAPAPQHAAANTREQSLRAQVAAFFAQKDERRQLAAADDIAAARSPAQRSYAQQMWFNVFRAFFEQQGPAKPRDERRDARGEQAGPKA